MWQVSTKSQKQNRDKEFDDDDTKHRKPVNLSDVKLDINLILNELLQTNKQNFDLLRDDGTYLVRFPDFVDLEHVWVVLCTKAMSQIKIRKIDRHYFERGSVEMRLLRSIVCCTYEVS